MFCAIAITLSRTGILNICLKDLANFTLFTLLLMANVSPLSMLYYQTKRKEHIAGCGPSSVKLYLTVTRISVQFGKRRSILISKSQPIDALPIFSSNDIFRGQNKKFFSGAKVKCCLFHFTQAIYRHIQSLGLAILYANDSAFNNWIRIIFGSSLLPCEVVPAFLTNHLNNWPQPQDQATTLILQQFTTYIRNQWIPIIELWNHHDNDGPRTTNHAEG